jgi:uncharacterized RDD family membrane protein YckC
MQNILQSNNIKKASFFKRLAAFFLTCFFVFALSFLFAYLLVDLQILKFEFFSTQFVLLFLAFVFLGFLSDSLFQCLLTFNLAKLILGLRVVDDSSLKSIGLIRALVRTFFSVFSFLFLGLGFFAILFNREKLSLHDTLSKSYVIDINNNLLTKIISAFLAFVICVPGIVSSLTVVVLLLASPVLFWDSMKDYGHKQVFELSQWIDNRNKTYNINLNKKNNELYPVVLIYDTAEFTDKFTLDLNESISLIDIDSFKDIKDLSLLRFDLRKYLQEKNIFKAFYIKYPKIIFKTQSNRDLTINHPKFYIANRNLIAKNLFNTFDLMFIEEQSKLQVALKENYKMILKNESISFQEKSSLLEAVYIIEDLWLKFLEELEIDEKSQLNDTKYPLANNIKIILDTQTGYVKDIQFLHPSNSTLFNRVSNRFVKDLQFKIMDPSDLDLTHNSFELILKYNQQI